MAKLGDIHQGSEQQDNFFALELWLAGRQDMFVVTIGLPMPDLDSVGAAIFAGLVDQRQQQGSVVGMYGAEKTFE